MIILIKNGNIVLPNETINADIKIQDEKIIEIGKNISGTFDETIDATGKYILAGGIDSHTHFQMKTAVTETADSFYTGTKAAVIGGTTTIIDFAHQERGKTLKSAVDEYTKMTENNCFSDYSYHVGITEWNDSVKAEMKDMVNFGLSSFKMYMAYSNLKVSDADIYEAIKESKKLNALIGFHCENGDLADARNKENILAGNTKPYFHKIARTELIEVEAVNRLITIAELADAPVWVVHLSTKCGLNKIKKARIRGVNIATETCIQYLLLDDSVYGTLEDTSFEVAKYIISPPLRKPENLDALWQGIINKDVDFISTDHCSFNFKGQKELGIDNYTKIPGGAGGVEHRFMLFYSEGVAKGKVSINDMTRLLSYNPAKVFGLTNKGSLEIGKDADIVILNPNEKWTISKDNQTQNVDYTPYEGFEINGKIEKVFLRGKAIVSNNKILESNPDGKFLKTQNCKPL